MTLYVLKRSASAAVLVWGVLSITFLIMQFAPGDPSSLYVRPDIEPQTLKNIRHQMGLDLPVWKQYFHWLRQFVRGNFGVSFVQQRPVSEILKEAIPNTLRLTSAVFLIQLVLGVFFGVITAVKRHSRLDHALSFLLLFVYSMPGFWIALMAILVFSLKLGWLPSSQMASFQVEGGFGAILLDRVRHLILPASVLGVPFAAFVARYVRSSFVEVLEQDYIRTAVAYGLKRRQILFKYALKNALLPLATLSGFYLPFLLGGAVITEYIFAWPGMGRVTVDAIFSHDFPVILATNFIAATMVVFGNLFSDLLYLIIDPRIKYAKTL